MDDVSLKGVAFQYDPTLDYVGRDKYAYVLDTKTIFPKHIEGENMKRHNPARPADQYVMYRALTWVGGLVCSQRNANAVYSVASCRNLRERGRPSLSLRKDALHVYHARSDTQGRGRGIGRAQV